MSVDISVSESEATTPAGTALGLTGAGSEAADFVWTALLPATPGAVNTGQTIN